ncbi:hypothetical protein GJ496_001204 [Pomphorhynchus laevis]|nr:hypothetical protein GJ496_001204 [Pomphorhynchus laevis]
MTKLVNYDDLNVNPTYERSELSLETIITSHCSIMDKTGIKKAIPTCIICTEQVVVQKEYNLKRHYTAKDAEEYAKYEEDERVILWKVAQDNSSVVEASYFISKAIAKAGKPFTVDDFFKKCMIHAVCPKKKILFCSISLSDNTVAERISNLSIALDETTDITYTSQLAIYVRGVDEKFHVTAELLTVNPLHGRTTAQEIFHLMCDALENVGLSWKRFVGITTDDALSMTGKKK